MSTIIQKAINNLIEGKNLNRTESKKIMKIIIRGEATDAQISAFLVDLPVCGWRLLVLSNQVKSEGLSRLILV